MGQLKGNNDKLHYLKKQFASKKAANPTMKSMQISTNSGVNFYSQPSDEVNSATRV